MATSCGFESHRPHQASDKVNVLEEVVTKWPKRRPIKLRRLPNGSARLNGCVIGVRNSSQIPNILMILANRLVNPTNKELPCFFFVLSFWYQSLLAHLIFVACTIIESDIRKR